jgi:DNA helicase-2/ATP-dependent DNA helicase PcrA
VSDLFQLTPPAPARAPAQAKTAASGEQLNAQQQAAVQHGDGPLLVVAGAGTGKTRVITERIRYLLESQPDLPGSAILGLTFTDKAAAEMKYRVARTAGERGKAVCLGTFHSFCSGLLLEHDPQLKTLEKEDHWVLLRRNLPVLALERYRRLAEPGQFLGDFVQFFSRCQDELVTPDDYERYVASLAAGYARERHALPDDERRVREEEIAKQQEIARAYRASDRLLRERHLLTFGMQLLDAVRLLDDDPAFAATVRQRFRYILVDEFQDTNVAQIEMLWRLGGEHRNIVAVGDNAQAIYRFRGASFGSFTIFLERFAGVPPADTQAAACFVRPLIDNYRSTGRILRVAGRIASLMEQSPLLPGKDLVPHKPDGDKVRIVEFASAREEARWIASEIARLHRAGQPWRTFAALYRIHSHRDALVEALGDRSIPFVIRNLSIVGHPLVRDILAYLRLIAKPSDNVACARVLAAPAWGLEAVELVRLCERTTHGQPSLWDVLQSAQGELPFSGAGRTTDVLVAGITDLRQRAYRLTAIEVFDALAEWLDLSVVVSPAERRYIDRLAQFLREWQAKSETSRLAEFVEYLDYFMQAGGQINLEQDSRDAVQLMTVHAAKGLEFDHVFVLRLTSRGFPISPRTSVLEFPEALMKEELPKGDFHTQEERRLFYVALTRARERLTLTTVVHKRSKPSLFLEDLLSAPKMARQNIEQSAPTVPAPPETLVRHAEGFLFGGPFDGSPDFSIPDSVGDSLGGGPLFSENRRNARVHSRIGKWAAEYRPPVFEPLQLSVSAIESYQKCPQKYLFANVWGIRGGPRAATTFGNVMHTTIRQFITALLRGQPLPFDEVELIFRREWTSAGFEDDYQEQCYLEDGLAQLRAFHTTCLAAPPDILAQEKRFVLELENGVQVTGRMDQINRAGASEIEVEIVDYKTGKPKTDVHARKELQLSVYALAALEEMELEPVRLVYHSLQTNERVIATRSEKLLNQVRGIIQEVAADIRAREFPAKPGYICKTCEFRYLCPAQESSRGQSLDPETEPQPNAPPPGSASKSK